MQVVREAYLTDSQIQEIKVKDTSAATDCEPDMQKIQVQKKAEQIYSFPYFPLYDEKEDKSFPVAYYFTGQGVIIPTGLNALYKKIYSAWNHEGLEKEADTSQEEEYLPASDKQVEGLHICLKQLISDDGRVKEKKFAFLRSVEFLLCGNSSSPMRYKMPFYPSEPFKGLILPVWSYSFLEGKNFLDGWVKLYRQYGLVPDEEEILGWLREQSEIEPVKLKDEEYKKLKERYRKADRVRLGDTYYELGERVFDDGRCWEVFEYAQPDFDKVCCCFPDGEWLSAKAPSENIIQGGLACIDLGTKNTVAVIGDPSTVSYYTLKFKRDPSGENCLYPTLLKFSNLESFQAAYESRIGRPETSSETVSIDNSDHADGKSATEQGIFRGLKQWMMDPRGEKGENAILRQKDAPDKPIILNAYVSGKNSVDPIELYAYYLGLYINNNRDNKIFMKYRLSFSEVCSEEIRRKMQESFKRGLKKSLPSSICECDVMRQFSVECACSEPAAYAVCALACMGMPSKCKDLFFYGIFDFGGGTCDFNYGIWKEEEDKRLHQKKYRICMMGSGGAPFLGGENLLELLAVEVCRELDKREEDDKKYGLKISRPRCYEGRDEDFFAISFEAAHNLDTLVERLRPEIWENSSDEDEENLTLSTLGLRSAERKDGLFSGPQSITVSRKLLMERLCAYIYEGISAFFDTYYRILEERQGHVEQFCVFLAGNSCRFRLIRPLFERYIDKELNRGYIQEVYLCDPMGSSEFKNNIPSELWDDDQKQTINERISILGDLDGKTGVAYGLALYGNQIEIENLDEKNRLLYYLGRSEFPCIRLLRGSGNDRLAIGESIPFAALDVCNLFYTKALPKSEMLRGVKVIQLDKWDVGMEENVVWYVKAKSQTEISIYAVSDDQSERYIPGTEQIFDLQSGEFKNVVSGGKA